MRNFSLSYVILITVMACGDDDGAGSVPLAEVPTVLEEELCAKAVECGRSPDQATCEATTFFIDADEVAELQAAVDRGTVIYDAGAAGACIDAFGDAFPCTISESLSAGLDEEAPEACANAIRGTVATGGACLIDEECVGGSAGDAECVPADGCTMDCCMGTCAAVDDGPPPAAENQPCTTEFFGSNCDDGLYCQTPSPDTAMGTCRRQVSEGACDAFDACAPPMLCDVDQTGTGTCYRPAAEGATCDPELGFTACDRTDNFCDPADTTCKKRRRPGESCALTDFSDNCVDWAWCMGGTCAAFPIEGQPCGGPDGGECLGDLECGETNTCVAPVDDDPVCTGA